MTVKVKICGLTDWQVASVAARYGASMLGFVFFEKSPRHVRLDHAKAIRASVPEAAEVVALTVDADDARLEAIVAALSPHWLQLHGQESPERTADIQQKFRLPVIKAVSVEDAEDFKAAEAYNHAEMLLFDAKPPKDSALPGGNGVAFDWSVMDKRKRDARPWMLAGGLSADRVAEAIRLAKPDYLDVSSGVEVRPGVKDPLLVRQFLEQVQHCQQV